MLIIVTRKYSIKRKRYNEQKIFYKKYVRRNLGYSIDPLRRSFRLFFDKTFRFFFLFCFTRKRYFLNTYENTFVMTSYTLEDNFFIKISL